MDALKIKKGLGRGLSSLIGETKVENIYNEILGPVFGQMSDELKRMEGSKLRNDPNYEFKLREKLMGQKKSLFPK